MSSGFSKSSIYSNILVGKTQVLGRVCILEALGVTYQPCHEP
jgi:hypothetical protein